MARTYEWENFHKYMEDLRIWLSLKPKWWQFRRMKYWKSKDPRLNWR